MSFYVTLPSNASTHLYQENDAGHYFVKLPQTIELSSQYEVGLAEIQFPNSYYNVLEDDVWIRYYQPSPTIDMSREEAVNRAWEATATLLLIPPGLYSNPELLITTLNHQILEHDKVKMRFHYIEPTRRVVVQLKQPGSEIRLSDKLTQLLKFHSSRIVYTDSSQYSESGVDIIFNYVLENDLWVKYYELSEATVDEGFRNVPVKKLRLLPAEAGAIVMTMPPGLYRDPRTFINKLNDLILKHDTADMRFEYDAHTNLASVNLFQEGSEIEISEKLKLMLNFQSAHVTYEDSVYHGEEPINMDKDLRTVYVYGDIVASRPVGDVMVPLLRSVPILNREGSSVFRKYDKPHYVPLSRFSFDTVEIILSSGEGQTIPFTSGTSVLTLHFRTRKHLALD